MLQEEIMTTEEFLEWHEGKGGRYAPWGLLKEIYNIFEKNGDGEDVDVDICYNHLSDSDKLKVTRIIRGYSQDSDLPLEEAKKDDELPPDPEVVKTGVHTVLNNLVTDEIEAVDAYEEAKAAIADTHIEHKDELIDTIDHIEDEEKEHIDELVDAEGKIPFDSEHKSEEVEVKPEEEIISDEEEIFTEKPVEEKLNEELKYAKEQLKELLDNGESFTLVDSEVTGNEGNFPEGDTFSHREYVIGKNDKEEYFVQEKLISHHGEVEEGFNFAVPDFEQFYELLKENIYLDRVELKEDCKVTVIDEDINKPLKLFVITPDLTDTLLDELKANDYKIDSIWVNNNEGFWFVRGDKPLDHFEAFGNNKDDDFLFVAEHDLEDDEMFLENGDVNKEYVIKSIVPVLSEWNGTYYPSGDDSIDYSIQIRSLKESVQEADDIIYNYVHREDAEGNKIPSWIYAGTISAAENIPEENIIELAKQYKYNLFVIEGYNIHKFIIAAKKVKLEDIRNDFDEFLLGTAVIYELDY